MNKRIKKTNEIECVAFKATIELNSEYKKRVHLNSDYYDSCSRLKPNGKYCFGDKERNVSYEDIEDLLTEAIEPKLKYKVKNLLGNEYIKDVKVISINEGCIEIVFIVLGFVGKALLDDIVCDIAKIAKKLLTEILTNAYGDFFDVDVCDCIGRNKRSAYFRNLLFSNFLLIGIILGMIMMAMMYLK